MITKLLEVNVLFKDMQLISKDICNDCNLMMNKELASWGLNIEESL
jgi:hypothetical protein